MRDAVDQFVASNDDDFRSTLHERIRKGDMRALGSYGNVTDLPHDVAADAIASLRQSVLQQLEEAKKGTYGLGGPEPLGALVLLNAWHPESADWSACEAALECSAAHPMHLQEGLRLLGRVADRVPDDVRARVQQLLRDIADRVPPDTLSFFTNVDLRGTAAIALALLFPDQVKGGWMRHLIHGTPSQREAAVEILVAREDGSQLNLLSLLARDPDPAVRAHAAEALATWCVQAIAVPDSGEVLQDLLDEPGVSLGVSVSRALMRDQAAPEAVEMLAAMLRTHPSAVVRARLALVQRPS